MPIVAFVLLDPKRAPGSGGSAPLCQPGAAHRCPVGAFQVRQSIFLSRLRFRLLNGVLNSTSQLLEVGCDL